MSTTDCGCRHHAVAQRAWGWAPAGSPCYSRKRGTGGGPKHGPALNLPTSRPRQTRTPTGGTAGTAGMPGWARAGGQALGQYSGGGGGLLGGAGDGLYGARLGTEAAGLGPGKTATPAASPLDTGEGQTACKQQQRHPRDNGRRLWVSLPSLWPAGGHCAKRPAAQACSTRTARSILRRRQIGTRSIRGKIFY